MWLQWMNYSNYWFLVLGTYAFEKLNILMDKRHNISHLYHLQDVPLESVNEIRYLGVTISSDLW